MLGVLPTVGKLLGVTLSIQHSVQLAAADATANGINRTPQDRGCFGEGRPGAITLSIVLSIRRGVVYSVPSVFAERTRRERQAGPDRADVEAPGDGGTAPGTSSLTEGTGPPPAASVAWNDKLTSDLSTVEYRYLEPLLPSTPPGGIDGMCGFNAAQAVSRRRFVRCAGALSAHQERGASYSGVNDSTCHP